MSSPSTKSRPSRSNQLPQRHPLRIHSAPLSAHRAQQPSSRSDAAHPSLAQLRHASASQSSTSPHACHNCHQMETRFYCDPCLSSRINAHHNEIRRLSLTRDKARQSVQLLLTDRLANPQASSTDVPPSPATGQTALPDPFNTSAAEGVPSELPQGSLLLQPLIELRARRAALVSRVQNIHQCIAQSQQSRLQAHESLQEQQARIVLRQQNLAKAWSSLEGSSAASSASASQRARHANRSRWLTHPAADHIDTPLIFTDVYTQYEKQEESAAPTPSPAEPVDTQLGAVLTHTRLQLASLQAEAATLSAELSVTRARLARQAFRLFTVSPPESTSSSRTTTTNSPRSRQADLSASSSVAQRISKLSERYIPGAFGLGQTQASLIGLSNPDSASSSRRSARTPSSRTSPKDSTWSIASLPLPLPSEVRRHSLEDVNGAVTYAVNLVQLLAAYLGITLPFCIEQHKGRFSLRPDPLWDGGGGSSAKTLYLSQRAYANLSSAHSSPTKTFKLNNLAESTIGLGASTLSTIESYIHLPSGAGLPWGTTHSPTSKSSSGSADADPETNDEGRTEGAERTSSASGTQSKPDQAARSFVSALVMLSYDVAYLAAKQGVQLDLVTAAANPLQLVSTIMRQSELGRRAHANFLPASSISDLSLPSLDYEQLAQILEPNNAAADGYKRGSSRPTKAAAANAATSRASGAAQASPHKLLEQSYVDVGEAAASVLGLKDPSSVAHTAKTKQTGRSASQKSKAEQKDADCQDAARRNVVDDLPIQNSAAKGRIVSAPAAQPPPSLEFLRQRGRDASKLKADTVAATSASSGSRRNESAAVTKPSTMPEPELAGPDSRKIGPGAVIFNGVEVGVGNMATGEGDRLAALGSRQVREKSRKRSTEEGWALV